MEEGTWVIGSGFISKCHEKKEKTRTVHPQSYNVGVAEYDELIVRLEEKLDELQSEATSVVKVAKSCEEVASMLLWCATMASERCQHLFFDEVFDPSVCYLIFLGEDIHPQILFAFKRLVQKAQDIEDLQERLLERCIRCYQRFSILQLSSSANSAAHRLPEQAGYLRNFISLVGETQTGFECVFNEVSKTEKSEALRKLILQEVSFLDIPTLQKANFYAYHSHNESIGALRELALKQLWDVAPSLPQTIRIIAAQLCDKAKRVRVIVLTLFSMILLLHSFLRYQRSRQIESEKLLATLGHLDTIRALSLALTLANEEATLNNVVKKQIQDKVVFLYVQTSDIVEKCELSLSFESLGVSSYVQEICRQAIDEIIPESSLSSPHEEVSQ